MSRSRLAARLHRLSQCESCLFCRPGNASQCRHAVAVCVARDGSRMVPPTPSATSSGRKAQSGRRLQPTRSRDMEGEPEAFNIWLKLPKGESRAELMGRMASRHVGLMPSDAFTVLGTPDEHVRICLGGVINREQLRAGLLFMANSLSDNGWMG